MDTTSSYRPGSRFAPRAIREGSIAIETYSPSLKSDLQGIPLNDIGDLDLTIGNKEKAMDQIALAAKKILSDRKAIVSLGGEHLISLPLITEFKSIYPDLKVLQLDAHADMRDEYQSESLSHATVMRRVIDVIGSKHLYQIGIRSGTKQEYTFMENIGSLYGWSQDELSRVIRSVGNVPCYLSLDLDILDPGIFPATGVPEPGGLTFDQVLDILFYFKDLNIVGIDVTEYNPLMDTTGHCSITVAKLIREMILLFVK
jgi:agmatinase